jgi:hypothetical protein
VINTDISALFEKLSPNDMLGATICNTIISPAFCTETNLVREADVTRSKNMHNLIVSVAMFREIPEAELHTTRNIFRIVQAFLVSFNFRLDCASRK